MDQLQILHISDLHISTDDKFDRNVVLNPMLERLGEDRREGFNPELVVVTGDIAYSGIKEEYELAKPFFDDLLKVLDLPDQRLLMVPGNHDVNREIYRPGDIPSYNEMKDLNKELKDYLDDLLKGMDNYYSFIETQQVTMGSNL